MSKSSNRVLMLAEVAIMTAAAFVLGRFEIGAFWAYGGSVSLEMLPILLMAFRRGPLLGMLTGLLTGLLDLIFGGVVLFALQVILDYPLPFLLVGVAGIFKLKGNQSLKRNISFIVIGTLVGTLLRFIPHFISGIVFFEKYAQIQPVWLYSILYNLGYLIPSFILCAAALGGLLSTRPQLFSLSQANRLTED